MRALRLTVRITPKNGICAQRIPGATFEDELGRDGVYLEV
jgi:hypothetical protein